MIELSAEIPPKSDHKYSAHTWQMISSSQPRMNRRCRAQTDVLGVCRQGTREFWEPRFVLSEQPPCAAFPVAWPCACALRWPPTPCSIALCQTNSNPVQYTETYPLDDFLNSLLVTLHLQESLDLGQGEVLPVSQSHQFIECTQEFEGIAEDLALVQALANAGSDLRKEVKTVNVLKDVRLTVGDENDVQLI